MKENGGDGGGYGMVVVNVVMVIQMITVFN